MENRTVSVVVPCYKGEKFIADCLNMLLSQSYKDLEIIVVIDGNVDRSAEIAKQFPVKVIILEQNRGLSAARNVGFQASQGEFVHFMDVDDKINKDFYKNLYNVITETGADVACAGIYCLGKPYKCQTFSRIKVITTVRGKMSVTWVGKWGYVWRYLFRKSMILQNNLEFEEGRLIEDMPYSFRALYYARKVVTVPHAVYTYEAVVENSIMNRREKEWRLRRRNDYHHSKDVVREFAKEHHITAPGVGFNFGRIRYIVRKYYINGTYALGLRKEAQQN